MSVYERSRGSIVSPPVEITLRCTRCDHTWHNTIRRSGSRRVIRASIRVHAQKVHLLGLRDASLFADEISRPIWRAIA